MVWVMDYTAGEQAIKFKNGTEYRGEVSEKQVPHGQGKLLDAFGYVLFEGIFKDGAAYRGYGMLKLSDGGSYRGYVDHGLADGDGVRYDIMGNLLFKGTFKQGVYERGYSVNRDEEGLMIDQQTWIDGQVEEHDLSYHKKTSSAKRSTLSRQSNFFSFLLDGPEWVS